MKTNFFKLLVLSAAINLVGCEQEDINSNSYILKEESSSIVWKGYSPVLFHDGSFSVKGENIQVVDGVLKSGTFTIPIASIENFDLPDEVKPVLLEHLKSADFFNIALHPRAQFKITNVQQISSLTTEENFKVTGDFTMLGQTRSINFPALIKLEGTDLKLDASFKLDRTKWGMNYAADPALGDHHILPEVDIELDILAGIE